jgi:hypothetical protein
MTPAVDRDAFPCVVSSRHHGPQDWRFLSIDQSPWREQDSEGPHIQQRRKSRVVLPSPDYPSRAVLLSFSVCRLHRCNCNHMTRCSIKCIVEGIASGKWRSPLVWEHPLIWSVWSRNETVGRGCTDYRDGERSIAYLSLESNHVLNGGLWPREGPCSICSSKSEMW